MAPKKQQKEEKEKILLKAEPRTLTGKRVRNMRKEGKLPANIFGADIESQSITVDMLEFRHVYSKVKATGVVYVEVGSKSIPCLVRQVQYHPVTDNTLHVDFRKINMKQKTEAEVPINIVGESEAVKMHNGVLITQMGELTVEALPADIPSSIDIDISALKEIGDVIKVSDIAQEKGYTLQDDPETVIVMVTAHKEESVEPDTTTTVPEEVAEEGERVEDDAAEEKKEE